MDASPKTTPGARREMSEESLLRTWANGRASGDYEAARLLEGVLWLLEELEVWCGINAYDSDKGPCDEHSCDESRGRQCSADELLDYAKRICGKGKV